MLACADAGIPRHWKEAIIMGSKALARLKSLAVALKAQEDAARLARLMAIGVKVVRLAS